MCDKSGALNSATYARGGNCANPYKPMRNAEPPRGVIGRGTGPGNFERKSSKNIGKTRFRRPAGKRRRAWRRQDLGGGPAKSQRGPRETLKTLGKTKGPTWMQEAHPGSASSPDDGHPVPETLNQNHWKPLVKQCFGVRRRDGGTPTGAKIWAGL